MTEQDYRNLFDRVSPGPELVERTLAAAEQGAGPRRRRMARRLIAAAACLALVLGVGNYPALAAGADGLLVEVHNDPKNALCDGAQSITPEAFRSLMGRLGDLARCLGREI